ncbi:MAG: shikimate kinase [Alphaproteobacteria bacterium]|nr:shikimate kinase [Alphaproteobacteria bacterium]
MIRFGFTRRARKPAPREIIAVKELLADKSIVLVGLMGCGKSAIGKRLAAALDLPFVDADDEIEKAAGKSISEIFEDHGEAEFREGERKVIARLLTNGPQILATGGGAFMDTETRARVAENGISVWLKADLPVLLRRVARRDNRPLLKNGNPAEVMEKLMRERYPTYSEASIVAESRDVPHEQIVTEIIEKLYDLSPDEK